MLDKYEYKLKFEQMKTLTAEGDYEAAAEIADTIQWRKVRNIKLLMKAGEIYSRQKRYEDAKEILQMAYDRSPIGRMIIYRLAEIAIKTKNFEEAQEYYNEFVKIAPHDSLKYVLRYKISKAKGADLLTRIAILEELKEADYTEEWAFELAYLYHKAGEYEKCIDACDELILWFGDGIYVERALELKLLHKPLTKTQEDKYRAYRQRKDGVKEVYPQEEVVQIPVVEEHVGKFDTSRLQEEIKKDFEQIMTPFLQEPAEEIPQQEQDSGAVRVSLQQIRPEKEEYSKPMEAQNTTDIMDLLEDVIPRMDAGVVSGQPSRKASFARDSQPVQKRGRMHMDNRIRRPQPEKEELTESELLRKIKRAKPRFKEQLGERQYISGRVFQPEILGQYSDLPGPESKLSGQNLDLPETARAEPSEQYPDLLEMAQEGRSGQSQDLLEMAQEELSEQNLDLSEMVQEELPEQNLDLPEMAQEELPEQYSDLPEMTQEERFDAGRQRAAVKGIPESYAVQSQIIDTVSYEECEAETDAVLPKEDGKPEESFLADDDGEPMEQEEMRAAEAEFFGIPIESLPDGGREVPEQGSLVAGILARQDTKEIKAKQIEEALDKHASEMLMEEAPAKIGGSTDAEQESVPEITKLDDELKEIFSYFVPVAGMESQICRVLTNTLAKFTGQDTSPGGHILIQGGRGCGKTILAKRLIKALKKESQRKDVTIGSIDAEKLNQKDPAKLLEKVAGGCLVIEQAGEITREAAIKLSLLLENDDTGILVILEDTRLGLEEALKKDEGFARKFTQRIMIPVFTSDELVEFGQAYAHERDYEIDNMGVLALYNRISNIQRLDRPTTLMEVRDIIDEAIGKAEKKSWKKAFSILTSRRYTENDYIILREKDFEE